MLALMLAIGVSSVLPFVKKRVWGGADLTVLILLIPNLVRELYRAHKWMMARLRFNFPLRPETRKGAKFLKWREELLKSQKVDEELKDEVPVWAR